MSFLNQIFALRAEDLAQEKRKRPIEIVRRNAECMPPARNFLSALRPRGQVPAIIAEVKRASPSQGIIQANADAVSQARRYAKGGAAALSVLTEPRYFHGSLDDLINVSRESVLPVLRKDFIFDPYQIYEARAAGADAVLLIASFLEESLLRDLLTLTHALGMVGLVEIHTAEDLERALRAGPPNVIGINHRNLHDLSVDISKTALLSPLIPPAVLKVAESGIRTAQDVQFLRQCGVDALLIGEALMRAADPTSFMRQLLPGGFSHDC